MYTYIFESPSVLSTILKVLSLNISATIYLYIVCMYLYISNNTFSITY